MKTTIFKIKIDLFQYVFPSQSLMMIKSKQEYNYSLNTHPIHHQGLSNALFVYLAKSQNIKTFWQQHNAVIFKCLRHVIKILT